MSPLDPEHRAVDRAIADVKSGKMVVVTDDQERENEADLIMSAQGATAEQVAFMIRHTSGILCVPLTASMARRLELPLMIAGEASPIRTAFTVSVDVRRGVTTGISAAERCATINRLADESAAADDFVRPGHIFPLIAVEGGVLMRSGHTEAAIDLTRAAGLAPAGLLAELVNDDGTVQKGRQVLEFAHTHGLTLVSIEALIKWRLRDEALIECQSESQANTPAGAARIRVYGTPFDDSQHIAAIFGDVKGGENVLTRLHRDEPLYDLFDRDKSLLERAFARIGEQKRGIIILLRSGAAGVSKGADMPRAAAASRAGSGNEVSVPDWKQVGLGAQILRDLGVRSIRVLGSTERHYTGTAAFGIGISGFEKL